MLLKSLGHRLLKETTRAVTYQAAQVAGGVFLCRPCQLSCPTPLEPLQECPVNSETELWVRFAPIGVLLLPLGFVLGLLVHGGKNRTAEVSYPNGRRGVGRVRYGTSRRPAAEDW